MNPSRKVLSGEHTKSVSARADIPRGPTGSKTRTWAF